MELKKPSSHTQAFVSASSTWPSPESQLGGVDVGLVVAEVSVVVGVMVLLETGSVVEDAVVLSDGPELEADVVVPASVAIRSVSNSSTN